MMVKNRMVNDGGYRNGWLIFIKLLNGWLMMVNWWLMMVGINLVGVVVRYLAGG